jgi:hypothetical protein
MDLHDNRKKFAKPDAWWQFLNAHSLSNCRGGVGYVPTYWITYYRVFWVLPLFYTKEIIK